MKLISIFVLVVLVGQISAQTGNLIINPSFEDFKTGKTLPACAYGDNQELFNILYQTWSSFPGCTPDLVVWQEGCHFPKPRSGDKAAGLLTYLPALDMGNKHDYHEFIQGKFARPLEKGKEYTFAFYIQLGKEAGERHVRSLNRGVKSLEVIPVAAGSLGVWFTEYEEKEMALDVAFPQLVWYDPIETQSGEWLLLSKKFKAERPFQYFTIGNFTTDNNTATDLPNTAEIDEYNTVNKSWQVRKRRVGYYLFDDFWLGEGPPPASAPSISEELKKSKTYTFKNVNFESGKADLLAGAMPELDGLVDFLKTNSEVKVEIGGHTDNVGNDETNRVLSEKRATAVANYLIFKGIDAKRVVAKGFGKTKPIAKNDTEAGRLKNRRVECKIK